MSQTVTAKWVFDEATMSRGRYWHWRKSPWIWGMTTAVGCILIIPGVLMLLRGTGIQPLPLFFIILGMYGICRYWIVGIRFRKLIRKNPQFGNTLSMAFSDTGFAGTGKGSEMTSEWSALYETATTPDGFLLYPQKEIFSWVPRSGFASEADARFVADHLQEKTKNKTIG